MRGEMKDIESNAGKATDSRQSKSPHTESDDMVETAQGEKEILEARAGAYRIWHCNGLPIKLRITKELT